MLLGSYRCNAKNTPEPSPLARAQPHSALRCFLLPLPSCQGTGNGLSEAAVESVVEVRCCDFREGFIFLAAFMVLLPLLVACASGTASGGTPLQFLSAVLGSERCPTEPKPKALTIAVRSNVNRAPFLKRNGASFMSIAERQRV